MNDIDVFEHRRAWLEQSFFQANGSDQARDRMLELSAKDGGGVKLDYLLRNHADEPIGESEIGQRDQLDCLLAYYSLREIAALIQYLPVSADDASISDSEELMLIPSVDRYATAHYPILLPHAFIARKKGEWRATIAVSDQVSAVFEEFLLLIKRIADDDEVDTFLWFVDDGWLDGQSLADTRRVLADPAKVAKAFKKSAARRDPCDKSVVGFSKFLRICDQLWWLLQEVRDIPVLRSALWHYHSYWFVQMKEGLSNVLQDAISNVEPWAVKSGSKNDMTQLIASLFDSANGEDYLIAAGPFLRPRIVLSVAHQMGLKKSWVAKVLSTRVTPLDFETIVHETFSTAVRFSAQDEGIKKFEAE